MFAYGAATNELLADMTHGILWISTDLVGTLGAGPGNIRDEELLTIPAVGHDSDTRSESIPKMVN